MPNLLKFLFPKTAQGEARGAGNAPAGTARPNLTPLQQNQRRIAEAQRIRDEALRKYREAVQNRNSQAPELYAAFLNANRELLKARQEGWRLQAQPPPAPRPPGVTRPGTGQPGTVRGAGQNPEQITGQVRPGPSGGQPLPPVRPPNAGDVPPPPPVSSGPSMKDMGPPSFTP
jgi:hypothetical protein